MEAEAYLNRLPMWANKKNSLKDIRIFLDQMGGPVRSLLSTQQVPTERALSARL